MAEPHPTDRVVRELIRRYTEAHERTKERLEAALKEGRRADAYRAWLREIRQELARLRILTLRWAAGGEGEPGAIEQAWLQGAEQALRDLQRAGQDVPQSLLVIPRDALQAAVEQLVLSLDEALWMAARQAQGLMAAAATLDQGERTRQEPRIIGRQVNDELRRAGLEAVARKITEGLSVRDMRRILVEDLVQRGITVVTDQAGRRWSLEAYADMVARTTSREMYTEGTLRVVQRLGHDLVRISTHWPTCDLCAARQGRVVSLSGRTEGWPTLDEIGRPPFHPRCGHSASPVVIDMLDPDEVQRLKELSRRPLDEDPRSKEEREAYERSQRINALRRERRRLQAQLASGEVPLNQHMQRWGQELQHPDLSPQRRAELEEKLGAAAERWEESARARLREINAELRRLNREQREVIQRKHREMMQQRRRRGNAA
ncbi:MAG: hypothetical protein LOD90_05275 [Symbiobacteriaceae bacterium]